jgi:hypothetical protein
LPMWCRVTFRWKRRDGTMVWSSISMAAVSNSTSKRRKNCGDHSMFKVPCSKVQTPTSFLPRVAGED